MVVKKGGLLKSTKEKSPVNLSTYRTLLAEREGFEPPIRRRMPVFKTGVIDHSTISPCLLRHEPPLFDVAKLTKPEQTDKL